MRPQTATLPSPERTAQPPANKSPYDHDGRTHHQHGWGDDDIRVSFIVVMVVRVIPMVTVMVALAPPPSAISYQTTGAGQEQTGTCSAQKHFRQ